MKRPNPFFHGVVDRLLENSEDTFKGPHISMRLPFQPGTSGTDVFADIKLKFPPYLHQESAFYRLRFQNGNSTLVATGTGSGKTECFMYPALDYCYQNWGQRGIKAIVIYPMNALANDQSKRFAETIYENLSLRNNVRAGLFIGQRDENASMVMQQDKVITNRDTLRLDPPDILLTKEP
jgi:DEAD/DEAH box helicase domain-containing protein